MAEFMRQTNDRLRKYSTGRCHACKRQQDTDVRRERRAREREEIAAVQDGSNEEWGLPPEHPLESVLRVSGACSGIGDWFEGGRLGTRRNKAICATCPLLPECRTVCDYLERRTTKHEPLVGVWGGEAPHNRTERRLKENRDARERAAA